LKSSLGRNISGLTLFWSTHQLLVELKWHWPSDIPGTLNRTWECEFLVGRKLPVKMRRMMRLLTKQIDITETYIIQISLRQRSDRYHWDRDKIDITETDIRKISLWLRSNRHHCDRDQTDITKTDMRQLSLRLRWDKYHWDWDQTDITETGSDRYYWDRYQTDITIGL
jgi:hypothetical protein